MIRFAVPSIVVGIIVAGLGILAIALGVGLLPSSEEAVERGTYAPLIIVWIMIALTVACAAALAAFLIARGMKGLSARKS